MHFIINELRVRVFIFYDKK